jgi:diadenosine tetraphosphate (Ap4A) HIT family hydrolase
MTTTLPEFEKKFRVSDLTVFKLDHWTWSIRPVHATLGAGVLSLNRFCSSFATLTTDESSELALAAKEIERRTKTAFGADKFNYIMLMMVDAHLHFHTIPRYGKSVDFAGRTWKDSGWPNLPNLGDGGEFAMDPILERIRAHLSAI